MKLYRFKDKVLEGFEPMFQSANDATAIRATEDHLEHGRIPKRMASDMALYCVGEDNVVTGRPTINAEPKHIIDLVELLENVDA